MGVPYYVVFDPKAELSDDLLRVYGWASASGTGCATITNSLI